MSNVIAISDFIQKREDKAEQRLVTYTDKIVEQFFVKRLEVGDNSTRCSEFLDIVEDSLTLIVDSVKGKATTLTESNEILQNALWLSVTGKDKMSFVAGDAKLCLEESTVDIDKTFIASMSLETNELVEYRTLRIHRPLDVFKNKMFGDGSGIGEMICQHYLTAVSRSMDCTYWSTEETIKGKFLLFVFATPIGAHQSHDGLKGLWVKINLGQAELSTYTAEV